MRNDLKRELKKKTKVEKKVEKYDSQAKFIKVNKKQKVVNVIRG